MKDISKGVLVFAALVIVTVQGCACSRDANPMPEGFKQVRLGMSAAELKSALDNKQLERVEVGNPIGMLKLEPAGAFQIAKFFFYSGETLQAVQFTAIPQARGQKELFDGFRAQAAKKFGAEGEFEDRVDEMFKFSHFARWVRCKEHVAYEIWHYQYKNYGEFVEIEIKNPKKECPDVPSAPKEAPAL